MELCETNRARKGLSPSAPTAALAAWVRRNFLSGARRRIGIGRRGTECSTPLWLASSTLAMRLAPLDGPGHPPLAEAVRHHLVDVALGAQATEGRVAKAVRQATVGQPTAIGSQAADDVPRIGMTGALERPDGHQQLAAVRGLIRLPPLAPSQDAPQCLGQAKPTQLAAGAMKIARALTRPFRAVATDHHPGLAQVVPFGEAGAEGLPELGAGAHLQVYLLGLPSPALTGFGFLALIGQAQIHLQITAARGALEVPLAVGFDEEPAHPAFAVAWFPLIEEPSALPLALLLTLLTDLTKQSMQRHPTWARRQDLA
jgi:hypothetical protein